MSTPQTKSRAKRFVFVSILGSLDWTKNENTPWITVKQWRGPGSAANQSYLARFMQPRPRVQVQRAATDSGSERRAACAGRSRKEYRVFRLCIGSPLDSA